MGTSRRYLRIIFGRINYSFDIAYTNIISCRPLSKYDGNRDPSKEEIELCSPKLQELYRSQTWTGVIYIGAIAKANFKTKLPTVTILHPASIARMEYQMTAIKEQAHKLNAYFSNLQKIPNSN